MPPFPETPAPERPGKVILIQHRLSGLGGHRYTEAVASLEEYRRRGREVVLFISRRAAPEIAQELHAAAVLDDPTFRLQWSFEERTRRFAEMLHTHITPIVERNDRVYLTVATQLETNALARWLRDLPAEKQPWIVTLFLSDRWNRQGPAERERQLEEFRVLRGELKQLSAAEDDRLMFYCVAEKLSEEISDLTGRPVTTVPMPLRYEPLPGGETPANSTPVVAVLGGVRPEKGSALLPEIVRACAGLVEVHFRIQMVREGLSVEDYAALLELAQAPAVTAISHELGIKEYAAAMQTADLALCPYHVIPYRQRTSAVFAEAVAYGKPAVVPQGTWLAQQITAGRAAGIICEDLTPEGYARAIAACVVNLPQLTREAQGLAGPWRESMSMARFTDIVETEIARRSGKPHRAFP